MKNKYVILLVIVFFIAGYLTSSYFEKEINAKIIKGNFTPSYVPESIDEIVRNCRDLNVMQTSLCLRDNVATFYKYTDTDDALTLSFESLKEYGGDCKNYAELYEVLGKKAGFETTTRSFLAIDNVAPGHRWTYVWDNEDYCVIDMLEVKCYERRQTC